MPARALLLVVAILVGGPAAAEEMIERFDSEVRILVDGTIEVTEQLDVRVEGREIRRGIFRDFPVEYREDDGRVSRATFEVVSVTRNGSAEPYAVERDGPYRRVRIGQADVFLPAPSAQSYRLTYRTGGHLRALRDRDELFWNVTGDGWRFPIETASVTVRLPGAIPITDFAGYTGPRGATGGDWTVFANDPGIFRAATTRPLAPGEGFSVAVAWPGGAVAVPEVDYVAGRAQPLMINGRRTGPAAAVLATFFGFLIMGGLWIAVGRDPDGGAIHPRFEPPDGLSPAATRYVRSLGFDRRCLPAAILSMAVKGALSIREAQPEGFLVFGKRYTLLPRGAEGRGLSAGERAAYARLFPAEEPLTLQADKTNGARVDAARSALLAELWDEHYRVTLVPNVRFTVAGAGAAGLLGAAVIGLAEGLQPDLPLLWLGAAVLAGALGHAAAGIVGGLRQGRRTGRYPGRLLGGRAAEALVVAALAVNIAGPLLATVPSGDAVAVTVALAGVVFGLVVLAFHVLMATPTRAGRAVLDQIEGFSLYMKTAEEDRLDVLNPPDRTPERFERLLPYAAALGLTHQWSAKFAGVLDGVATPAWFDGRGDGFDVGDFGRDFGGAVAATSVPSRDSSGSGGGGSSGGGGGGGGGGGW